MPSRLEVATRHTAAELRRLARHERDRRAAMRMLALAETMDGADRAAAARRGDMSDQALPMRSSAIMRKGSTVCMTVRARAGRRSCRKRSAANCVRSS
jgi:hypothetical protein